MKSVERGFNFGMDGTDCHYAPVCDFCGKHYESPGVQVIFAISYEICPSCLLKGPKVVASETTRRPAREFHEGIRRWFMEVKGFANKLKAFDDFRELPGGILALKIAEAYQEAGNSPKGRKSKAA